MDCNKEEALRAKDLAEKKMQGRDFTGARKFALKAQQLFPDVENISQMLVVCDVHCAAEQKLYGNEMNWYKILQIDLTADEATIKKQYRKFALQLHPDKNKYAGAEAAFKLIGEAQRVLLDKEKRSDLDRKCRVSMHRPTMAPHHQQKVPMNYNSVAQNTVRPNFTSFSPWQLQQQQSTQSSQQGLNGGRTTFWTACSFCLVRYEYYREVLNRSLRCQHCNKPFIAYDMDVQGTTPATNLGQQTFTQRTYGLNHGGAVKVDFGAQGNLRTKKSPTESSTKKSYTESRANKGSSSDVSKNPNGKRRRKQMVESSESADSLSSDSEDDMFANNDGFPDVQKNSTSREERPRRSTRQKHQISYNENASDGDDDESFEPSRRDTAGGSSNPANEMNNQNGLASGLKANKGAKRDSEEDLVNTNAVGNSKADEASENDVVYPDPEFSDFDKDKKEESFKAGQIWAIYDMTDGMPRFYALIRKVASPGLKVQITWFEPDPVDDDEISWSIKELPIACGKFKLGSPDIIEGLETFSHQIICQKVGRSSFNVFPRKGETWALFKNWDIKWHKDPESHRKFDFEFVEILSDYSEGEGVTVAYLAKLKGFVSLFYPALKDGNPYFRIPAAQLFRFSHRVPSFRMTGKEGVGVPMGSMELDPVSLPRNMDEIDVPQGLKGKISQSPSVGMSSRSPNASKFMTKSDTDASTSKINLEGGNSTVRTKAPGDHIANGSAPSASVAAAIQVPKPQFFNFDEDKSPRRLAPGQIWAFYCEKDGAPRNYGLIIRVNTSPAFEVHVMNLTNCWLPDTAVKWDDRKMILTCGRFRIIPSPVSRIYNDTNSFSHLLHPVSDGTGKEKEYIIFPRKGQVWALYRRWSSKIKRTDLLKMEYDIVEVVEEDNYSLGTVVLPLEKVSGYDSVFKGKSNGRSAATLKIPSRKLLMFSHQIPAFRFTEEHGNLKGFLAINPRALPSNYANNNR